MPSFTRDLYGRLVRLESPNSSVSSRQPSPGLPLIVDLGLLPMANMNEGNPPNVLPPNPNVIPNIPNPNMNAEPNFPNLPDPIPNVGGGNEFDHGSNHGDMAAPQYRTLRDYMNPPRQAPSSCIIIPPHYATLNIRPGMMQLLPQFHGMDSERPYAFIK